jgi:carbon-monoxide dehydrogenase large subunit
MAQAVKAMGEPVPRKEDERFLTGRGNFVSDLLLPGTVYASFVRSPYAHARVTRIDVQ